MYSRIFTTAIILMIITAIASIALSYFASPDLAKAALIGATTFSGGIFGIGMIFLGNQKAKGNRFFTPINFNVIACLLVSFAVLAAIFAFQDVTQFKDSVFDAISGATFGAAVGLIAGFAKKDDFFSVDENKEEEEVIK